MFNGEKFSQVITHQGNLVRITGRLNSVEQLPPTGSYNQMYLIGAEDATRFEKYLWNVSTQQWDYKGISVIMDWDDKQDLLVLHSSGTAAAQEITEPRIPELHEGLKLIIIPSANLSASPTLNINGLGAIPIKRRNNANGTLYAGARTGWLTAEHAYTLVYSNGNFIVTEFDKVSFTDTVGYKHDSTSTTYGTGSKTNYGHVKLVDDLEHSTYVDGEALAASVGYKLKNLIGDLTTLASAAKDSLVNAFNELFQTVKTHIESKQNPHNVTKSQVGLGNVNNTADANKNVASAKKLTTARNINGVPFNGTQDITIEDSTKIPKDLMGMPNGVAILDAEGKIPGAANPSKYLIAAGTVLCPSTFVDVTEEGEVFLRADGSGSYLVHVSVHDEVFAKDMRNHVVDDSTGIKYLVAMSSGVVTLKEVN